MLPLTWHRFEIVVSDSASNLPEFIIDTWASSFMAHVERMFQFHSHNEFTKL
jgi:hypothetical protein